MIKKVITITRGDLSTLIYEFDGQFAGQFFLTAKLDMDITATRIIDIIGVSSYDSITNKTSVTFTITGDLTANINQHLYYDITYEYEDVQQTMVKGIIYLDYDVRTPYDQTDIEPERYIPVKRSKFNTGQFIKATITNGVLEFEGYNSLRNGIFELDMEGNLMPKENYDVDDVFEIDSEGNITTKEIV